MGRFAHIDVVGLGTTLVADGGFTCLRAGEEADVGIDDTGLFVHCADGKHYLDGQLKGRKYVGFSVIP